MSLNKMDAEGVMRASQSNIAAAAQPEEAKVAPVAAAPQEPKSILKPPSQSYQEYGSKPPSLNNVSIAPQTYSEKLE